MPVITKKPIITENELDVIEQTFGSLQNFMMYYEAFAQKQEEDRGLYPVEFDSHEYTSECLVPGIIVSVKESPRKIEIEAIIEDYHRILKLDTPYAREARRV